MFRCSQCGAEFDSPKQVELTGKYEINDDILLVCPYCDDDRISYVWDSQNTTNKREENKV